MALALFSGQIDGFRVNPLRTWRHAFAMLLARAFREKGQLQKVCRRTCGFVI